KTFNLLHLNPGASGREGFHKVRTALRFNIDGEKVKDMEVIELGLRS
ncbi:MAG: YfcE family phosphodiesterase, partial [Saprospiraceae bacterium]